MESERVWFYIAVEGKTTETIYDHYMYFITGT